MKDINNVYNESILTGRSATVAKGVAKAQAEVDMPEINMWFTKRTNAYSGIRTREDGSSYVRVRIPEKQSLIIGSTPDVVLSGECIKLGSSYDESEDDEKKEYDIRFENSDITDLTKFDFLRNVNVRNISFYNCSSLKSFKGLPVDTINGRFLVKGCTNLESLEGMPRNVKFVTIISAGEKKFDYNEIKKYCKVTKSNCIWG